MSGKVRINLKGLKNKVNKAAPRFHVLIGKFLKQKILDFLIKGISPVAGFARFEKYSESYTEKIESVRKKNKKLKKQGTRSNSQFSGKLKSPVNLKLSGDLHSSLEVTQTERNKTVVRFKDFKAKFHNELGVGKKKILRRLLPTNSGEEFSKVIQREIVKKAKEALK